MTNEQIMDQLDSINKKMSGLIGRLSVLRGVSSLGKECHDISLEIGAKIDDLINGL